MLTDEEKKRKAVARAKAWSAANPERVAASRKARAEAHPGRAYERSRAWRVSNPERYAATRKAYSKANPEKAAARSRAWFAANPEKAEAANKRYRGNLSDVYVVLTLTRKSGLLPETVPPELIELRREQLATFRLVREFNQLIKSLNTKVEK